MRPGPPLAPAAVSALLAKNDVHDALHFGAREEELTYGQAADFIKTALEFGRMGIMPAGRCLHLAIGTAAQFELMLRQMDVIGEWAKATANRKLPIGIPTLEYGHDIWAGFFTWENIPGWRWRMKTSKSKYRSAADFDLTRYGLLYPLLDEVPHENRTGAIVKGEKNLPVRQAMYGRWWRQIARAAGIPDTVWNMDARAGGATEADEAGAAIDAIQGALTHSKESTTLRYIRRGRTKKIEQVAEARASKRAARVMSSNHWLMTFASMVFMNRSLFLKIRSLMAAIGTERAFPLASSQRSSPIKVTTRSGLSSAST